MSNEKGSFSADISQNAIDEALKSVERHKAPGSEAVTVEIETVSLPERPVPSPGVSKKATPILSVAKPSAAPVDESGATVDAEAEELASLRAQLELSQAKGRELMEKLKDTHERMLRSAADLDNYKKRALRERDEAQRFGIEKLLKDFLPVMDNFERALEHAQNADPASLLKGVQMTRKQFEDALSKNGVRGFSAKGQAFDPRLHEAMSQIETSGPANQIVSEMARGYFLNDRLVRPALVVVSATPGENARAAEEPITYVGPAPVLPEEPGTDASADVDKKNGGAS